MRKKLEHSIKAVVQDGKAISGAVKETSRMCLWVVRYCGVRLASGGVVRLPCKRVLLVGARPAAAAAPRAAGTASHGLARLATFSSPAAYPAAELLQPEVSDAAPSQPAQLDVLIHSCIDPLAALQWWSPAPTPAASSSSWTR